MKSKALFLAVLPAITLVSCDSDYEPQILIEKLDYSIENSSPPYDVYFYLLFSDKTDYDITWYFGDGTESHSQMPVHTYYDNGAYTVKVIIKNGSKTTTRVINLDFSLPHSPVAKFYWYSSSTTAPAEVKFLNFSKFMDYCYWDFGDGYGSDAIEPAHVYEKPGTYSVKLEITSGDYTTGTEQEITINQVTF